MRNRLDSIGIGVLRRRCCRTVRDRVCVFQSVNLVHSPARVAQRSNPKCADFRERASSLAVAAWRFCVWLCCESVASSRARVSIRLQTDSPHTTLHFEHCACSMHSAIPTRFQRDLKRLKFCWLTAGCSVRTTTTPLPLFMNQFPARVYIATRAAALLSCSVRAAT